MDSESVRKLSPSDTRALNCFVKLERNLVGSNPLFVSDLDSDLIKRLSGKSASYRVMERQLFVVSKGHQDLARCAALINPNYQKAKNEAVGFIGYFAAAPKSSPQVQAMLEQAETWLRERGVSRVIAPHNGAALWGGFVLMTAAFDEDPIAPFGWNPSYYADYLSASGYRPTYPLWVYRIDFSSGKYRAAVKRVAENKAVRVRPISKRRWDSDVWTFGEIMNKTFAHLWQFHPFANEEWRELFRELKLIARPSQMLIAEMDGEPVGICTGLPDLNPLMRPLKGKLSPIQMIKILIGTRRYSRAGLDNIGVLPEYRRIGVAQTLAITLCREYQKHGMKETFYYFVNDDNIRSRRFAESIGGTGRVVYHCYDKRLS